MESIYLSAFGFKNRLSNLSELISKLTKSNAQSDTRKLFVQDSTPRSDELKICENKFKSKEIEYSTKIKILEDKNNELTKKALRLNTQVGNKESTIKQYTQVISELKEKLSLNQEKTPRFAIPKNSKSTFKPEPVIIEFSKRNKNETESKIRSLISSFFKHFNASSSKLDIALNNYCQRFSTFMESTQFHFSDTTQNLKLIISHYKEEIANIKEEVQTQQSFFKKADISKNILFRTKITAIKTQTIELRNCFSSVLKLSQENILLKIFDPIKSGVIKQICSYQKRSTDFHEENKALALYELQKSKIVIHTLEDKLNERKEVIEELRKRAEVYEETLQKMKIETNQLKNTQHSLNSKLEQQASLYRIQIKNVLSVCSQKCQSLTLRLHNMELLTNKKCKVQEGKLRKLYNTIEKVAPLIKPKKLPADFLSSLREELHRTYRCHTEIIYQKFDFISLRLEDVHTKVVDQFSSYNDKLIKLRNNVPKVHQKNFLQLKKQTQINKATKKCIKDFNSSKHSIKQYLTENLSNLVSYYRNIIPLILLKSGSTSKSISLSIAENVFRMIDDIPEKIKQPLNDLSKIINSFIINYLTKTTRLYTHKYHYLCNKFLDDKLCNYNQKIKIIINTLNTIKIPHFSPHSKLIKQQMLVLERKINAYESTIQEKHEAIQKLESTNSALSESLTHSRSEATKAWSENCFLQEANIQMSEKLIKLQNKLEEEKGEFASPLYEYSRKLHSHELGTHEIGAMHELHSVNPVANRIGSSSSINTAPLPGMGKAQKTDQLNSGFFFHFRGHLMKCLELVPLNAIKPLENQFLFEENSFSF